MSYAHGGEIVEMLRDYVQAHPAPQALLYVVMMAYIYVLLLVLGGTPTQGGATSHAADAPPNSTEAIRFHNDESAAAAAARVSTQEGESPTAPGLQNPANLDLTNANSAPSFFCGAEGVEKTCDQKGLVAVGAQSGGGGGGASSNAHGPGTYPGNHGTYVVQRDAINEDIHDILTTASMEPATLANRAFDSVASLARRLIAVLVAYLILRRDFRKPRFNPNDPDDFFPFFSYFHYYVDEPSPPPWCSLVANAFRKEASSGKFLIFAPKGARGNSSAKGDPVRKAIESDRRHNEALAHQATPPIFAVPTGPTIDATPTASAAEAPARASATVSDTVSVDDDSSDPEHEYDAGLYRTGEDHEYCDNEYEE